jgi:hypothetical protein
VDEGMIDQGVEYKQPSICEKGDYNYQSRRGMGPNLEDVQIP